MFLSSIYLNVNGSSVHIFDFDMPPLFISMQIVILPVHLVASRFANFDDITFINLSRFIYTFTIHPNDTAARSAGQPDP